MLRLVREFPQCFRVGQRGRRAIPLFGVIGHRLAAHDDLVPIHQIGAPLADKQTGRRGNIRAKVADFVRDIQLHRLAIRIGEQPLEERAVRSRARVIQLGRAVAVKIDQPCQTDPVPQAVRTDALAAADTHRRIQYLRIGPRPLRGQAARTIRRPRSGQHHRAGQRGAQKSFACFAHGIFLPFIAAVHVPASS